MHVKVYAHRALFHSNTKGSILLTPLPFIFHFILEFHTSTHRGTSVSYCNDFYNLFNHTLNDVNLGTATNVAMSILVHESFPMCVGTIIISQTH